jgi:hypothetical protein
MNLIFGAIMGRAFMVAIRSTHGSRPAIRLGYTEHNKEPIMRAATTIAIGLVVALPVVYFLSAGPVGWLNDRGYIDIKMDQCLFYRPMERATARSQVLASAMDWYRGLWYQFRAQQTTNFDAGHGLYESLPARWRNVWNFDDAALLRSGMAKWEHNTITATSLNTRRRLSTLNAVRRHNPMLYEALTGEEIDTNNRRTLPWLRPASRRLSLGWGVWEP